MIVRPLSSCVAAAMLLQTAHQTVTVTAVPEQCSKATAFELWHKTFERFPHRPDQASEMGSWEVPAFGRGAMPVWFTRIAQRQVGPECRWSFSDLPEGDYVAVLVRPDGSGGSQKSHVAADGSQEIAIPAPTVTLAGIITLD